MSRSGWSGELLRFGRRRLGGEAGWGRHELTLRPAKDWPPELESSRPKNNAKFRILTPAEARRWALHIDHFATLAPISELA